MSRSATLKNKTNLVINSDIELGEQEGNGKGRYFMSRFIEPGIAHYEELGDILITKETLNKFIQTMVGVPVIIDHEDVTDKNVDKLRVGSVSKVWFNEFDGYFYCEGILTDPEAIDLVKNQGWNVSCAYSFVADETKKQHNGKGIDMEFTDGEFLHLAIVKNPRYEGANIVVNKNDDDVEWITVKGNHIPIKKDQSKDEAVKEFLEGKEKGKQDNKEADIALTMMAQDYEKRGNKGTADRANELKEKLKKGEELSDKDKQDIKTAIESYKPKDKPGGSGSDFKPIEPDSDFLKIADKGHKAANIVQHLMYKYNNNGDLPDKSFKDDAEEIISYAETKNDNFLKDLASDIKKGDDDWDDDTYRRTLQEMAECIVRDEKKQTKNSIGDITMTVLNDLTDFIKKVVKNEKEDEMKEVKNEDKRKLIDEVGGILKGKVDEELWRTVIGKLEKIAYEPSEDDKADNKAKNEDEEDKEEAKNKCKNEEDEKEEEIKEDIVEDEDDEKEEKEEKAENKKVKNSLGDIVMGGNIEAHQSKLYTSRKERLEEGNKY